MAMLEPISQLGLLPMPLGQGLNAPVSNGDIGRCIAAALVAPEKHGGHTYRPCGPELLSPLQIADGFGNVLRRPVRYQDISERMFLKAARSMGFPIGLISQLRIYFAEYRRGAFAAGAPNDAVLHLTGQDAEDFETTIRGYVQPGEFSTGLVPSIAQVRSTNRTAWNLLHALFSFAKLLLIPAPNVDRYENDHHFPRIRNLRMALENEAWISSHESPNAFGSADAEALTLENAAQA